jgi:uncharacterized SAM-binding protein YcdF (DUF218 family)
VIVILAAFAAVAVATVVLFLRPRTDEPRQADAVVMLGPGLEGERVAPSVRLVRRGVAPVLVVSRARDPGWEAGHRLCGGKRQAFEVVCIRSSPFTTRGEARTVRRLAASRRWRSLVVVTSTYHVTRARLLYERCFDGRVDVVAARPKVGLADWVGAVAHEWAGLAYAVAVERSC